MEVLDQPTWNFAMKTQLEVKETHMANILTVAEASTKKPCVRKRLVTANFAGKKS